MDNKPLLILDIDGVLNPISTIIDNSDLDWNFNVQAVSSEGFHLQLSREMAAALTSLGCKIQWLTTWIFDQDLANEEIGPLIGLNHKTCCSINKSLHDGYAIKLDAMYKILANKGPKVIWIDDEIEYILKSKDTKDFDPHKRCLKIIPNSTIGITKQHIKEMEVFLDD
jgi:hypothetical protein